MRAALRSWTRRFARAQDGVSALEFALIAPLMILFYFGVTELTQGYMVQRRVNHATAAIADLVTQRQQVSKAELADVFLVGQLTVAPFPDDTLRLRITSVLADSKGVAKVVWSEAQGMSARAAGTTVPTPNGLVAAGTSIIVAEVQYEYESPTKMVMNGITKFEHTYYLSPRLSPQVVLK